MSDIAENTNETAPEAFDSAKLSDASRWLAALSYAFVAVVFVLYESKRRPPDAYVRFHARQGFVLFFVEVVLVVVTTLMAYTVGKLEVSGALIMVTWELLFGLLAVAVRLPAQSAAAPKMATVLAWLVRPKRRVCMGGPPVG